MVDLHVAALEVDGGVHAERLLDFGQVHPGFDPLQLLVAQLAIRGAVAVFTDVVDVLSGLCRTSGQYSVMTGKVLYAKVRTDDRSHELAVAIHQRGHAGEARVIVVATLDETLASGHLRTQGLALGALGVAEHGELALAGRVWYTCELVVGVCQAIADEDGCEVDVLQPGRSESPTQKI